jgi:hypothetical protein
MHKVFRKNQNVLSDFVNLLFFRRNFFNLSGPNVIKHINIHNEQVFERGKPFQSSLSFAGKAGACPIKHISGAPL